MHEAGRRPFVCGNWKMNATVPEAGALAKEVRRLVAQVRGVEVAVAPASVALVPVARRLLGSSVGVCAQAVHPKPSGAYTGEVSVAMLASAGCGYAIVGHSERRMYCGIDDAAVAARVRAVLDGGLVPIVCVGERLEERDGGRTLDRVREQVAAAGAVVQPEEAASLVIAYEPVWAIGTGRTASPAQAQEVHAFIRGLLRDRFGADAAARIRIQYGGSVKPGNVDALLAQRDVDGALVGGASLDAESFARIVRFQRPAGDEPRR